MKRVHTTPLKPGEELFEAVQRSQGFAFISDAISDWPKESVLTIAEASLEHTQETAKILRKFIKKHSRP